MIIEIDPMFTATLERISADNKMTSQQYAASLVNSFLEGQYRGEIIDALKEKPTAEINDINTVLKASKEELETIATELKTKEEVIIKPISK